MNGWNAMFMIVKQNYGASLLESINYATTLVASAWVFKLQVCSR